LIDFDCLSSGAVGQALLLHRSHTVPLSGMALRLIKAEGFGVSKNVVSDIVWRYQIVEERWSAHDLRRSALTKMAELGVAPIVLGHIANHRTTTKAGITLGVYVHHAYEKEKRAALELWADRLEGIISGAGKVVALGSGRCVDAVPIADQVAWDLIPGECFRQLLRDPFCRRVRCHIDKGKLSPSQPDNDQNVELDKANGRNHEQIHGRDVRHMIAQERAPALTRRLASLGHVLGDGRFSHRKAELEQFAMNMRCTPKPIVNAHPPDQRPQFPRDLRPASRGAGFPAPVTTKPSAMPAHHGLWPDDYHGPENRGEPTI
jgi:hypothetical protein